MYCTKCGNQVPDDAEFCTRCGQPLRQTSQVGIPVDVQKIEKAQKKPRKKPGIKRVLGIGVIVVLLLWVIRSIGKSNAEEEAYANGCLNFEVIISQCKDCEASLRTLADICGLSAAYGYDEDEVNACIMRKYQEMQHDCTAEIIQVENVPYAYRGSFGTYSGDWQGAGPTGTGTYVGKYPLYDGFVSYTGDWKYGLPEGEGELYITNYLNTYDDLAYAGQMSAGLRNGTGYMYEYNHGGGVNQKRIYGKTQFQNDNLAVETDAVTCDAVTGEVIRYTRLIGDGNGYVVSLAIWGADELSPEQQQVMDMLMLGTMCYIVYKGVKETPPLFDADAYTEEHRQMILAQEATWEAEKEEEAKKAEEEAKKEQEFRDYNYDLYREALYNDPNEEWYTTKNYKYNAGLGY